QPDEPGHLDEPVQPGEPRDSSVASASPLLQKPPPRDAAEPLTAELSRMHVTVSREFLEKLEAARAALSHTHPSGSIEQILEAGLDLILARHAKRNGLTDQPRKPRPAPAKFSSEAYIPAAVRSEVWKRDKGRCQWPLKSGGICASTQRVEDD